MSNSKDDSLNRQELEELWETAKYEGDAVDQLIVVCGGYLGMRASEIGSLRKSWIDMDRKTIEIPSEDPSAGFKAKAEASVRTLFYDLVNDRVADVLEGFFRNRDAVDLSRNSIYRRTKKIARWSDLDKEVYPHALRATAAFMLAQAGLNSQGIRQLMGWKKLDTAQKYIRQAGLAGKRQLEENQGKLW